MIMASVGKIISNKLPCMLLLTLLSLSPKIIVARNVHQALFVFGDSLFDAGNNPHYRPDLEYTYLRWPYGMAMNGATGRLSDGLLVPDHLAQLAGMNPVPPCLGLEPNDVPLQGCNVASAGSGVVAPNPNAMNLGVQLRVFKEIIGRIEVEVGDKGLVKDMVKKAVFLLSVGGNDHFRYSASSRNATELEIQHHVEAVIEEILEALKEIYEMGGRKFAFQDVGPLGCYPSFKVRTGLFHGCDDFALKVASVHNVALRNAFQNWQQTPIYGDVKYGIFDYYNALKDRMFMPSKYDFLVGDVSCCGYGSYLNARDCGKGMYFLCSNPSAFVLFDGGHTTQKLNSQLAHLMWNGDSHVIAPYNVKQLFEEDCDEYSPNSSFLAMEKCNQLHLH